MTTQHTPGPWKRRTLQSQRVVSTGWHIEAPDGSSVTVVLGDKSEELQANARLIAAAPDLLEALEFLLACVDDFVDRGWIIKNYDGYLPRNDARAAIAKAKGGPA